MYKFCENFLVVEKSTTIFMSKSVKSPFSKEKWIDHCSLARRPVVPVNLVVMMLVVHGVYVSVRKYVKGWKEARGYR